ncbi:MAG: lipoate--protein ligase, partial [Clostridia bacterium]|nr:lipoate--protein ligase [Clostridia bacterium]
MNSVLISKTLDAYENIAGDEYLLSSLGDDGMLLYLYVNKSAVIIGRNQNPWIECNLNQLDADGVQLVRRVSGGGAVYHDEGNLNFSFICKSERYSESEQTALILRALSSFGISAAATGRNDIVIGDRKISGNAYCRMGSNQLRHGTILISSDLTVFDRYLNVPKMKLEAKGVKSVKARIGRLSDIIPGITVDMVKNAIISEFQKTYGDAKEFAFTPDDEKAVLSLVNKHKSWEWKMGQQPKFDFALENRFSWGMAQIHITVDEGKI